MDQALLNWCRRLAVTRTVFVNIDTTWKQALPPDPNRYLIVWVGSPATTYQISVNPNISTSFGILQQVNWPTIMFSEDIHGGIVQGAWYVTAGGAIPNQPIFTSSYRDIDRRILDAYVARELSHIQPP